jgi:hypothetical protein
MIIRLQRGVDTPSTSIPPICGIIPYLFNIFRDYPCFISLCYLPYEDICNVLALLAQWDRQFESRLELDVCVDLCAVICLNVVLFYVICVF